MTSNDIITLRLFNQHLSRPDFTTPTQAVAYLGAVQAQDFAAAKWSLGLRIAQPSDREIENAYNEGKILRTHVMRPTWHFVAPEDIRWMEELTAPRVKTLLAHYNRKLELDHQVFSKTNKLINKSLANHRYLTRQQLKSIFTKNGINTDVQRLAHIVMWAELEGLICSGPQLNKQLSYALMEERVPKTKKISRDQALAKLAHNYFSSHGPAQMKDFSWWSGLSLKDAQSALDFIKSKLNCETVNEKKYWFKQAKTQIKSHSSDVYLLSIYDEYTIAYKDRSDINENQFGVEKMIAMGNAFTAVIIIAGRVAGTWKRMIKKNSVVITTNLFQKLSAAQKDQLEAAADRYGRFLNLPLSLT